MKIFLLTVRVVAGDEANLSKLEEALIEVARGAKASLAPFKDTEGEVILSSVEELPTTMH